MVQGSIYTSELAAACLQGRRSLPVMIPRCDSVLHVAGTACLSSHVQWPLQFFMGEMNVLLTVRTGEARLALAWCSSVSN